MFVVRSSPVHHHRRVLLSSWQQRVVGPGQRAAASQMMVSGRMDREYSSQSQQQQPQQSSSSMSVPTTRTRIPQHQYQYHHHRQEPPLVPSPSVHLLQQPQPQHRWFSSQPAAVSNDDEPEVVLHRSGGSRPNEEEEEHPSSTSTTTTTSSKNKKTDRSAQRRRIQEKDPITLTDRAAARIQELFQSHTDNDDEVIGIRLGVKRRGCNGLSYTLNYVTAKNIPKQDVRMVSPQGVTVFIEPMALFNVVGTQMDWEETELSSEFTFHNPNSKGQCGCGESFNV